MCISFYLSYRIVLYRFKTGLSYRFYRGSIKQFLFIIQNDIDHLSTSAGACPTLCPKNILIYFFSDRWRAERLVKSKSQSNQASQSGVNTQRLPTPVTCRGPGGRGQELSRPQDLRSVSADVTQSQRRRTTKKVYLRSGQVGLGDRVEIHQV